MVGPFLRAVNLSKRYGGVEALRGVSLDIYPGEVIGVVGDTNSGKSTLLDLIAGGLRPDDGRFYVEGKPVRLWPVYHAVRHGIRAVHQNINIAEHMSAIGYIFGGQTPQRRVPLRWLGWWDKDQLRRQAEAEFVRLGFVPPPLDCPLNDLTSAQRKMVAFVHATIWSPRLLLLDEPMDALESHKAHIFRLIEHARAAGNSVLLVTQNLEDVFHISDRILVLNAGQKIAVRHKSDTTAEEIVSLILGSVEDKLTPAVWALSNYFEVRRQADELDRLNKALEQRAIQLQAHAEVARSVTSILDRDELLTQIVEIIQQHFGYYHVAIFLLDSSKQYAVLRSCASQSPRQPGPGEVQIPLGDGTMVGWCITTGQAHLANDVSQDALFKPESTLPDARAELVLPLRIGGRILGVLDLQSARVNAFGEDDVLVLQSLADQLAIAIRNADLYEAARVAREQADLANRSKSVFLSNMSHELRTPLSAIIGLTQAMLNPDSRFYNVPVPEEYLRDLTTIRKSGEHLLALINDILDLSQIEAGELKLSQTVIDLSSLLDDARHTASGLLHGRPIMLRTEYPGSLPFVWGDSVHTRQVVLNLIANAIKFTERGSITLRARVEADTCVVSVADTGIGIPEHRREAIFERFQQGDAFTSRKYGGTGLGLNICQQLVHLQGGRIWVESQLGKGTEIFFTLPLATPAQVASYAAQVHDTRPFDARRMVVFSAGELTDTKHLIVLAQDETPDSFALRQALENAGYVVEHMPATVDVIEMVDIMPPDLIVLDATGAHGADLVRRVADAPHILALPLIVLADEVSGLASQLSGSARVIAKLEATPRAVLNMVEACLA
jgi:signal transduction histidine kinase/ABC-type branched-subunit amino acid transport system ATPase component